MAKAVTVPFEGSPARVFEAVRRAVAGLGYTVKFTDADAHAISFNTGMSMFSWSGQDMTVSLFPDEQPGETNAIFTGGLAKVGTVVTGGQLVSFGEKDRIVAKVVKAVIEVLPAVPEPQAPAATPVSAPAVAPTTSAAGELERLAELHRSGLLTDTEFAAAKAQALGLPTP